MRRGTGLEDVTLFQGAAISLSGAVAALLVALRTHAQAPVCGLAHCPACYVATALAMVGILLGGVGWNLRAEARIRRGIERT